MRLQQDGEPLRYEGLINSNITLLNRSMDLMLHNEEERAQALKVVRRVIAVVGAIEHGQRRHRAAYIDPGLLRCLAAVARAGTAGDGSSNRLARPAIATLAEICKLFY